MIKVVNRKEKITTKIHKRNFPIASGNCAIQTKGFMASFSLMMARKIDAAYSKRGNLEIHTLSLWI
jgi:hypothetical protein